LRRLPFEPSEVVSLQRRGVWNIEIEEAPLIKIYTLPAIE
jgi:hypothetical protein